jgi:hypothetical protein
MLLGRQYLKTRRIEPAPAGVSHEDYPHGQRVNQSNSAAPWERFSVPSSPDRRERLSSVKKEAPSRFPPELQQWKPEWMPYETKTLP